MATINLTHFVGTVIADGWRRDRILGTIRGTILVCRGRLRRVTGFRLVAATELFHRRVARFRRLMEERLSCLRDGPRAFSLNQTALCPAHVGAGSGIDFDRFTLSDK